MGKKPTYEGHDQKVQELEREVHASRRAKKELQRSEENAWALLNAPPEWAVLIDSKLAILDVNEVGAKRLGKSRDELIGMPVHELFTPKVATFREARAKEVLRSKKPLRFIDEREGRFFDTSIYPILDEQGQVDRMAIFAKEITAQKQAEEALRASEAQKKAILDASIDRIRLVDRDMRIIWANKTTTKELRVRPEDLVGKHCYEVFLGRNTPCPRCPTTKVLKSGKIEHAYMYQAKSRCMRGETYWENYAVPIKNESGAIENIIQITRNITKKVKSEKALEESKAELEMRKRSLEEVNTALRVLVERREEDRKELEERVLLNVKELVVPLLEKVKEGRLDHKQKTYLDLLESNLNDIISPFTRTLTSKHLGLTSTELRIASMIKEGKKTKEMARLMNLSSRTVESHRESIRKKMGIKNRRANLRSHLLSA
jgi:PAS domain S-box-containing protein